MSLRIGVDVGGTNTDSVLIDPTGISSTGNGVLAFHKVPTTPNVSEGIETAIREIFTRSNVKPSEVACVSIGTTAFINAVLEADPRRLKKVAVIRLCGPYTRQAPPFIDFPKRLRKLIEGHVGYIDGGLEIDGRPIMPLNEEQVVNECGMIRTKQLRNIVLSGVFSPLDNQGANEYRVRDIITKVLGPSVNVVCSREVGQVGLLERENASILNASILSYARRTIYGFSQAIKTLGLSASLYITQNDGTLTTAANAARLPIRTFASGPTNSMQGASLLAGLGEQSPDSGKPTIVVDVGGTTTDVGVLLPSGFPRQAASFIEIGGVRTNFGMADVQSIGLGGGSRVRQLGPGAVTVGPDSVGRNIQKDALVFGGDVVTATDIVVAAGKANVGDISKVSSLQQEIIDRAVKRIKKMLEGIIDRMKTSPEDVTLLLVGGGGIISPESLAGVCNILRPPFFDVANAVGAAMAKVAYEIDTYEIVAERPVHTIIEDYKAKAIDGAIKTGAERTTTRIVDVANLPVNYVTNQSTRIIVKAAGDLAVASHHAANDNERLSIACNMVDNEHETLAESLDLHVEDEVPFDIDSYKPYIQEDRAWVLSETDLEWIAEGCSVLGTGGGGSSYPPFLMARQLLRDGKQFLVVDADDVPEDALFIRFSFMGSPSVSAERIQGGNELPTAIQALQAYMGFKEFAGTISEEIGGGNGIQPLIMSATLGKVTLDADLMGRAYPHMWQSLPGVYNIKNGLYPSAIADGVGNSLVYPHARNGVAVENILRSICTEMGSKAGVSFAPLTRRACQDFGVAKTVSQAWRIGRAIALCRRGNDMKAVPSAILKLQNGACLFVGKIIDVRREVRKGFTWGQVTIAPLLDEEDESQHVASKDAHRAYEPDDRLVIPFQNENLYAYIPTSQGHKVLVTVPDLITVLDSQSGVALGTPDYRYGLRVTVIALAGDPKWSKTEIGLAKGGPAAFGLEDIMFVPTAEYKQPESVIKEYA